MQKNSAPKKFSSVTEVVAEVVNQFALEYEAAEQDGLSAKEIEKRLQEKSHKCIDNLRSTGRLSL